MQYSPNNKLKLMEGTDNVKRQDFVDNFNAIDNGLSKFYVATLNSTNVYKVTTGLNKTNLTNGYSIKVAIPSDSNGAISLIVDSCSAVSVKKANGNAVTNFKANGVYSLTYYNSVFILASGGVDDVSFSASDLLTGKSANDSNGEKINGTMPNRGAVTATLNAGGSYTIPAGYHNGSGKVSVNSLATQMANNGVTLTSASQLISGIKAYSKTGQLLTGNTTIQSLGGKQYKEDSFSLGKSGSKTIDSGFPVSSISVKVQIGTSASSITGQIFYLTYNSISNLWYSSVSTYTNTFTITKTNNGFTLNNGANYYMNVNYKIYG